MKIFIGSSGKHADVAEKLAGYIEKLGHEPVPWTKLSVFSSSEYTLESIYKVAEDVNAGLFVFAPDDLLADKSFITRDNVIFETGIFFGMKGRKNTAIYFVDSEHTKKMSDLRGVTYIDGAAGEYITMTKLRGWLENIYDVGRNRNVWLGSRDEIEAVYTIEERFSMIEHIREVRFLNFASTVILTPDLVDPHHAGAVILSEKINRLLEMGKYVEFIITEPGSFAMKDAVDKVANNTVGDNIEATFYAAYAGIIEKLKDHESPFYKAYTDRRRRFNYYVTDIALPFAIFITEYEKGYEKYNCIKIDLYSAELKAEKDRRSMYIMEANDPKNYEFFRNNYFDIRSRCCKDNHEPAHRREWLEKWDEIKKKLDKTGDIV